MGCEFCKHETDLIEVKAETSQCNAAKSGTLKGVGRGNRKQFSKNIFTIATPSGFQIESLIQVDRDHFAVGTADGTITVYSLTREGPKPIYTLKGHSGAVKTLLKLEDGRLASGSGDTTIKVWNLSEKHLELEITEHSKWVNCLMQPRDTNLLVSGSEDGTIQFYDLAINKNAGEIRVEQNIGCLADLGDGKFASSVLDVVKIWDLNTKKELFSFPGAFSTIVCLISLSSGNLITGANKGAIKCYDMLTKNKIFNFKQGETLNAMALIDDSTLATTSGYGIKLWDLNDYSEVRSITGHSGEVKVLLKMEDYLISGANDKQIKIWE